MNITEYFENNVSFLYLEGRFDSNTSWKVERHIRDRIGQNISKFLLNMGVPFIASSGLRVVLAMTKELRQKHRGDLRLSALQATVSKVFELSGLYNVLKIYDEVQDAAASFKE